MVDTIILEIDSGRELTSEDFACKTEWGSRYQQKTNNSLKYGSWAIMGWPQEAEDKWAYLPEVKFMNYPNPNPRTMLRGDRCYKYRISFSAPKLLYGNNIEEVTESQFDEIIDLLYEQLQFLALPTQISKYDIECGKICRVDFSKNAMLAEPIPADQLCGILMQSEHIYRSKISRIEYHHGELYRENIKSRSVVVYDKLAEFSNTTKKPTNVREQFFLSAEKAHLFQVFKMEVQIQTHRQVKLELKPFGVNNNTIGFRDIFSKDLAHQVLMKYWKGIIKGLNPNAEPFSEENLLSNFTNMVINRGGKRPQNIFATIGFRYLAHKCGMTAVKDVMYKYWSDQAWLRLRQSLYDGPESNDGIYALIDSMEKCIDSMEPLKFEEEDEYVANW